MTSQPLTGREVNAIILLEGFYGGSTGAGGLAQFNWYYSSRQPSLGRVAVVPF